MERERCTARRRDGERCGAPAVRGAPVCRRHGGASPNVMRAAQARSALQIHLATMPYLEECVARLVASHERYLAKLADGDKPRRCRVRRTDGQPCGGWAIRGGYVCRVHGGAAPQVRAKANIRLESARIYREFARSVGRTSGSGQRRPGRPGAEAKPANQSRMLGKLGEDEARVLRGDLDAMAALLFG